MQLYEMQVSKTTITRAEPALIPKGIIGAVVKLSFSAEWEGLTKTAVFRAGEVTKDVADIQDAVVIPAECTREEGELLQLGIYGVDAQGTVAIPTLWASIGRITEAADPSGDETTDPSLPVWAQVLEMVKQLEEQGVTQNEVEQAVADFFGGQVPPGRATAEGGEIFNFYTDPVYTGDNPPKEFPGNTAAKGAHAQNFGTHADGEYSSASGWNSTASGGIANATGRETEASGYAATTEGHLTKASGRCAHAGGKESEATGENAFAHGYKAKASGYTSFAIGEDTEASGYCAVVSGYKTKASGTCSSASGRDTEAREYASSAFGRGTVATARNQQARGAWNVLDVPDASGIGTYADIVGGGKSDTERKNIYTLDWDGNAEFAGKVYSGGVEVAPGGFGLGKQAGYLVTDLNDARVNGWVYWGEGTKNVPPLIYNSTYGAGFVIARNEKDITQFVVAGKAVTYSSTLAAMRSYANGEWDEWEYINPPMIGDAEYRTTKRFAGNPIYIKRFAFGTLPDGTSDNTGVKEVDCGVDANKIMEFSGYAYKSGETNPLPLGYMGALGAYAYINGTRIGISTMNALSGYQAIFYLEYIK